MSASEERVVLLNDDGSPLGAAPKADVHSDATPLHLAFSCYVVDSERDRLLLTRRALTKKTWPGTWTNTFCGHPEPFEPIPEAVHRRAEQELGLKIRDLHLVLPDFRYRAVDASGIVENEICPVYVAVIDSDITPEPTEVMQTQWSRPEHLLQAVEATPWAFSPWMVDQIREMVALPSSSMISWGLEAAR
jgi:isopentenyl-diphosphate delta-isomerase